MREQVTLHKVDSVGNVKFDRILARHFKRFEGDVRCKDLCIGNVHRNGNCNYARACPYICDGSPPRRFLQPGNGFFNEQFCFGPWDQNIWRDIKVRYKQTMLGAAWAVLQPVLTMLAFYFIFDRIGNVPVDADTPYPIFSYTALLPWGLFVAALNQASRSLTSNTNMITKIYFPRLILPLSSVLAGLIDFAIASVILVGLMFYYQYTPAWNILWTLPLLRKTPYDPVKDFAPLSLVSREVNVVAVHPSLPVKSVKELLALAKARPGELNYSTGSKGSATHLAAELFMSIANVKIVSVPYKNERYDNAERGAVYEDFVKGKLKNS